MSFANRSFPMFRSVAPGLLGNSSTGRAQEEQSLFPTMTEDGKDIRMITFKPLNPALGLWVQLASSIAMTVTGLAFAYYGCYRGVECFGYFILLYLRAVFWVISYIVHRYVRSKHNLLKLLGYHTFLLSTHQWKKAPLQIVSVSNILILTIHTILLETLGARYFIECSAKGFSTTLAISVFCLIECLILCFVHGSYYVKVHIFNAVQNLPDALDNADFRRTGQTAISPEEFINHQFTMITKLMEENRHLRDKIREACAPVNLINSESTHLSMVEQSFIGM